MHYFFAIVVHAANGSNDAVSLIICERSLGQYKVKNSKKLFFSIYAELSFFSEF